MKLATALHSLGLTCSALDLSKIIVTVDTYIKKETPIAKPPLLANVGPDGIVSHGALVLYIFITNHTRLARPSHLCHTLPIGGLRDRQPKQSESRLYLYSWARDSALVFRLLVEDLVSRSDDPSLRRPTDAFISAQTII